MKKNLTVFILAFLLFTVKGNAQCVPDVSITDPGIFPDSAAGLPHAYLGVPYSTDIQFRVPVDTVYLGLPAIITSIDVTNVTGLPTGFTYTCTPSNCSFPGGSNGCMLLQSSNPTTVGDFPIVVEMNVYGTVFGIPQTLPTTNDNYHVIIENNVAVISPSVSAFSVGQNQPNPSHELTQIPVSSPSPVYVDVKISDLIGKVVYNSKVYVPKGSSMIPVSTSGMRKGIYVYSVSNGSTTFSKRMIIAD